MKRRIFLCLFLFTSFINFTYSYDDIRDCYSKAKTEQETYRCYLKDEISELSFTDYKYGNKGLDSYQYKDFYIQKLNHYKLVQQYYSRGMKEYQDIQKIIILIYQKLALLGLENNALHDTISYSNEIINVYDKKEAFAYYALANAYLREEKYEDSKENILNAIKYKKDSIWEEEIDLLNEEINNVVEGINSLINSGIKETYSNNYLHDKILIEESIYKENVIFIFGLIKSLVKEKSKYNQQLYYEGLKKQLEAMLEKDSNLIMITSLLGLVEKELDGFKYY